MPFVAIDDLEGSSYVLLPKFIDVGMRHFNSLKSPTTLCLNYDNRIADVNVEYFVTFTSLRRFHLMHCYRIVLENLNRVRTIWNCASEFEEMSPRFNGN